MKKIFSLLVVAVMTLSALALPENALQTRRAKAPVAQKVSHKLTKERALELRDSHKAKAAAFRAPARKADAYADAINIVCTDYSVGAGYFFYIGSASNDEWKVELYFMNGPTGNFSGEAAESVICYLYDANETEIEAYLLSGVGTNTSFDGYVQDMGGTIYHLQLSFDVPDPVGNQTIYFVDPVDAMYYGETKDWYMFAENTGEVVGSFDILTTGDLTGRYSSEDFDFAYTWLGFVEGKDTTYVEAYTLEAEVVPVPDHGDSIFITMLGTDAILYDIHLFKAHVVADNEIEVQINNATFYDEREDYGLFQFVAVDEEEGLKIALAFISESEIGGEYGLFDIYAEYTSVGFRSASDQSWHYYVVDAAHAIRVWEEDGAWICEGTLISNHTEIIFRISTLDDQKPVINSVEQGETHNTSIELVVDAEDNKTALENLTFDITGEGGIYLLESAAYDELFLGGLEQGHSYEISIVAYDEWGLVSDPFVMTITTANDNEVPVVTQAEVAGFANYKAFLNLQATDDQTAPENIRWLISTDDGEELYRYDDENNIVFPTEPETTYVLLIQAMDEAGNLSESQEISFTTPALEPFVLDIDEVYATYFSTYSSDGAENFYFLFLNSKTNEGYYVDAYSDAVDAISGDYSSEQGNISARYSLYTTNADEEDAESVSFTSVEMTVEFLGELDEEYGFGKYHIIVTALGADGIEYTGEYTGFVTTYYTSGNNQYAVPMSGEVEEEPVDPGESEYEGVDNVNGQVKAVKAIRNGNLFIIRNNSVYDAMGRCVQ